MPRHLRTRIVAAAFAVLAALAARYPPGLSGADRGTTEDYAIGGFQTWAVAKNNGFTFQPIPHGSGQWVSDPRDGVNTRLLARTRAAQGMEDTVTLAQVAAGSGSVNRPRSGSRTVSFEFFAGRLLAPGWTVAHVELAGRFSWVRQAAVGSGDLSFRVSASSDPATTGTVLVTAVVLRGPAGAHWEDAFHRRPARQSERSP
jgi:hypothetical protein